MRLNLPFSVPVLGSVSGMSNGSVKSLMQYTLQATTFLLICSSPLVCGRPYDYDQYVRGNHGCLSESSAQITGGTFV